LAIDDKKRIAMDPVSNDFREPIRVQISDYNHGIVSDVSFANPKSFKSDSIAVGNKGTLRWATIIIKVETFLGTITVGIEAVYKTISVVILLVGAVFGRRKIAYEKEQGKTSGEETKEKHNMG